MELFWCCTLYSYIIKRVHRFTFTRVRFHPWLVQTTNFFFRSCLTAPLTKMLRRCLLMCCLNQSDGNTCVLHPLALNLGWHQDSPQPTQPPLILGNIDLGKGVMWPDQTRRTGPRITDHFTDHRVTGDLPIPSNNPDSFHQSLSN